MTTSSFGGRSVRPMLFATAALVTLGATASASASIVIDSGDPGNPFDDLVLDVRASIGMGMNASYLIVDFSQTGGDAYAWEYRWNPGETPTGETMLVAIDSMTDLAVDLQDSSFGIFVGNFTLDAEGEDGDPAEFWQYFTAEAEDVDPGVLWTSSPVGIGGRYLSNGSLDGWLNSFAPGVGDPAVPVAPIPVPAGLALMAVAGVGGMRRRRRA